jgi:hypothetical protein
MVHYLQQEFRVQARGRSARSSFVLQARDEKIGLILVIILRGTAREEFNEFDESKEFKETNALLFRREQIGPIWESDCGRSTIELLQLRELLELLLIRSPCLKPAAEGEPCLAS